MPFRSRTNLNSRKTTTIAVVTVIALILFFVGYSSVVDHSFRQYQFNSMRWKEGAIRVRGEMVRSLLDRSVLHGKSKKEVVALLGRPDEDRKVQFLYRVDVGRRIAWKTFMMTLCINFDGDMRVSSAELVD